MTTLSDEALLARLQDGDSGALTTLYRRHQGRVYRFALAMSGEAHTAEEVTQEVFLVLLQGGTGYRPESGSFLPYLMGMARNHVLRALRRKRDWVELEEDHEPPSTESTLLRLTREETRETLYRAVLSLPPNYREAVVLCDLQEMDYAEAAQVLGVPIGTVRSRLSRARALLAGKLRPDHLRMPS
jgi:RNA polymerase sigma-70 factor (ECF subfamily)